MNHLFESMRPTSTPGTSRSRAGILVAPDRRISSCVSTWTAAGLLKRRSGFFDTVVTSTSSNCSRLSSVRSRRYSAASTMWQWSRAHHSNAMAHACPAPTMGFAHLRGLRSTAWQTPPLTMRIFTIETKRVQRSCRRRFVDHEPVQAKLAGSFVERVEVDRLAYVAVRAEVI